MLREMVSRGVCLVLALLLLASCGAGGSRAPHPGLMDGGQAPAPPPPSSGPDADGDGVPDTLDRCSHTPMGKAVWTTGAWAGCAAGQLSNSDDGDRDGVPNGQDRCPKTGINVKVYTTGAKAGCPLGEGGPAPKPPAPKKDGGTPAPPPPPPPPPKKDSGTPKPPPGSWLSAKEKDLLSAINQARKNNGLPAVTADPKLTCAARMHAIDVAGGCDHTGSDGSWPWDRAKKCGFPQTTWTVNEICAGPGFKSGPEAVWGWKQSSGHWAALVSSKAKLVGLGVGSNGCYVALFDCCVAKM